MSYKKTKRTLEPLPEGWETRRDLMEMLIKDGEFLLSLSGKMPKIPDTLERLEGIFFPQKSWKLSRLGFEVLHATYACYCFHHAENLFTPNAILAIGARLKGPWYVTSGQRIYIWDSVFHFEISMFDGNINQFARFNEPK